MDERGSAGETACFASPRIFLAATPNARSARVCGKAAPTNICARVREPPSVVVTLTPAHCVFPQIFALQSVDNFFAVLQRVGKAGFRRDQDADLEYIYGLVGEIPWQDGAYRSARGPIGNRSHRLPLAQHRAL